MSQPFDRGARTYYLDDERLAAFRALSCEDKLRWQEEIAHFIRLTRQSSEVQAADNCAPTPGSACAPVAQAK